MKNIIIMTTIIFLLSCSSIDTNRIAPGYVAAFTSIKQLITGDQSSIASDLIDQIPYASMLVSIGNGPKALMILERISGDEYTWVSADQIYIVTRKGKIIKTGDASLALILEEKGYEWLTVEKT